MSLADIGVFGVEPEDEFHPDFAKVLLGFDPRHVEEYVSQAAERIVALEQELRETKEKLDATRRRATHAREAVYQEIASRMAEVMRAADEQSEKLRREATDDHRRMVAEARQEAGQIRREAEDFSERLRTEAEAELRSAKVEAARVLGALIVHRDALLDELATMRTHLEGLIGKLDRVTTAPRAEGGVVLTPTVALSMDDLLGSLEGFDLALPATAATESREAPVQPGSENHQGPAPSSQDRGPAWLDPAAWEEGVRLLDLSELTAEGSMKLDPSIQPDDLDPAEGEAGDQPVPEADLPAQAGPEGSVARDDAQAQFDTETVTLSELWEEDPPDENGLFGPPLT